MKKSMVFETDLLLEKTEGGNNIMIDMNGIQLLVPVEKVRRLLEGKIKGTSISVSTGEINRNQEPFITSREIKVEEDEEG